MAVSSELLSLEVARERASFSNLSKLFTFFETFLIVYVFESLRLRQVYISHKTVIAIR